MRPVSPVLAASLASCLVAACATSVPTLPVAVEYTRTDCAAAPDLSAAIGLTPPKERPAFTVTTPVVAATTPCLTRPGGNRPYVVYAVPTDFEDKTLTIGATLEPTRILSPEVVTLDRQGQVVRTFDPTDYYYRGLNYSVLFRPRATEAYVLVAADPARIGKRYDSIHIGTNTTTISTGLVTSSWTSGVDHGQSRIFSYEGSVQVLVNDSDVAEKGVAAAQ